MNQFSLTVSIWLWRRLDHPFLQMRKMSSMWAMWLAQGPIARSVAGQNFQVLLQFSFLHMLTLPLLGKFYIEKKKASGGDGIPVKLFQILKDGAVKVPHSICQLIWKTQQWPQDWKGQFSFQSQRKAMPENAQTTAQLHSSHMLVK